MYVRLWFTETWSCSVTLGFPWLYPNSCTSTFPILTPISPGQSQQGSGWCKPAQCSQTPQPVQTIITKTCSTQPGSLMGSDEKSIHIPTLETEEQRQSCPGLKLGIFPQIPLSMLPGITAFLCHVSNIYSKLRCSWKWQVQGLTAIWLHSACSYVGCCLLSFS